ncbi:helix-turn-helix domain-containing protein [Fredinandcohnia sp. 179-A 10B2 NHS]|uniref:helix-turn-helix domain-containing protein n=1 Tax=Fredinandcohnia sp. 179-A 10B2 NHS TaxID=3235176 RepID=UPI0039A36E14
MLWEWHEQVEIMYVLSGTGKCYIEDKVYTFSEGDLFVIGPHKLHKTELLPQQDFKVYIVLFSIELQKYFPNHDNMDVLQFIKLNFADYPERLFLEKEVRESLTSIIHAMFVENKIKEADSLGYIISLLHILLIELNRIFSKTVISKRNVVITELGLPRGVVDAIGLINQRFKEELNLSKIAYSLGINPSYLSRQFKQSTGLTITQFVASRRVEFAKNLLTKTDKNITEVAYDAGFSNTSYFSTVFKEIVGMSPAQFRKASITIKSQK